MPLILAGRRGKSRACGACAHRSSWLFHTLKLQMAQTATVEIQMPEMGESVTEGIVLEWHVAEGDFVNEGDTVVEVSTDKVDAEVPAPTAGVITKLIASVDEEVPVGVPLAEMEPGEDGDSGFLKDAAATERETPAEE